MEVVAALFWHKGVSPLSVVDWDAKPEPWRSIGKMWAAKVRGILADYVMPEIPVRQRPGPGDRLRDLRRGRGLTQLALAQRAGYADTHISAIETGRIKQPRISMRRDIAQALGVTVKEIWR